MLVQDVGEEQVQQAAFFFFASIYYPILLNWDPPAAEEFENKFLTPQDMEILARLPYSFLHLRMCTALPARFLGPLKKQLIEGAPAANEWILPRVLGILAELDEPACIALMDDLILNPHWCDREAPIVTAVKYLEDEKAAAFLRKWAAHFSAAASEAFDEVILQAWLLDMPETVQWILEILARETTQENTELFETLWDILELVPASSYPWSPMTLFMEDEDQHTTALQACFPFTLPLSRLKAIYQRETVQPWDDLEQCFHSLTEPTPKQCMAHAILKAYREWDPHSEVFQLLSPWFLDLFGFSGPPNWDLLGQATPDQLCDLLDHDLVLAPMLVKMAPVLKNNEGVLDRFKQYLEREEKPNTAWLDILEELALPHSAPLLAGLLGREGVEQRQIMSFLKDLGWEDLPSQEIERSESLLDDDLLKMDKEAGRFLSNLAVNIINNETIPMSMMLKYLLTIRPDKRYLDALDKRFQENRFSRPWDRKGFALILSGLNRFYSVKDNPALACYVHEALIHREAMLDFTSDPPEYLELPLACDQCSAIHEYRVHEVLVFDGMEMPHGMFVMEEFPCLTCGAWTQLLLPDAAVPKVVEEWEAIDYRASYILTFDDEIEDLWAIIQQLLSDVAKYPYAANPRLALARFYQSLNHFGKAKDILQEVIRFSPSSVQAHFLLGRAWIKEGQWEKAYEILLQGGQTMSAMNWRHMNLEFRGKYLEFTIKAAMRSGNPIPTFVDTLQSPIIKTGRNEPCPCESGLKYKKCCGRRK